MEPVNKLDEAATPKRLLAGLNCWKTGQYDLIVTTGGVYMPPNIQTIPAARLMADWLTARGVRLKKFCWRMIPWIPSPTFHLPSGCAPTTA